MMIMMTILQSIRMIYLWSSPRRLDSSPPCCCQCSLRGWTRWAGSQGQWRLCIGWAPSYTCQPIRSEYYVVSTNQRWVLSCVNQSESMIHSPVIAPLGGWPRYTESTTSQVDHHLLDRLVVDAGLSVVHCSAAVIALGQGEPRQRDSLQAGAGSSASS